MTENHKNSHRPIVVRRSVTLFVMRVIILELLFEIIYLTWRGVIHFLPVPVETTVTLNLVSIIFFIITITIVQNVILVIIALRWVNDYYEIRPDEVVHKTGILSKTEKAYPFRDIQSITIKQGIVGRLFNYGNVTFYIPTLGDELHFNEISDPSGFIVSVKGAMPAADEAGKFIFKK